MKKLFRTFRIIFVAFVIILGVISYQKFQENQNPACKDCNLILISVDTLRPDHMGVYGYNKNTTPNIDKWAKDAIVFTNMRTMVPTTYPSFSVLMTGKSAFDPQIYNNSVGYDNNPAVGFIPINQNVKTLAQILKENGYLTAAFINTDSLDGELTSLNKGFDIYNKYQQIPLNGPGQEYKSYTNVDEALKWLKKNKNKKFFLWIHLMEPHAAYLPIKEFYCKFNTQFCNIIKNKDDLWKLENERQQLKECHPEGLPKEKVDLFQTLYDGAIASSDKLIGKIFDEVEELKLQKNTTLIFYGDHGEGFDHNYYFFHDQNLYDSFIKIPLIIKSPYLNTLTKINTPLQNTQILPIILDLLSLSNEKIYNKISMLNPNPSKYSFYVNNSLTKYAIFDGRYKFIYSTPGACLLNNNYDELYDVILDPYEKLNIISQKTTIANELKTKLLDYLGSNGLPSKLEDISAKNNQKVDKKVINNLKSLGY